MGIKTYEKYPTLSPEEVLAKTETIWEMLKATHYYLDDAEIQGRKNWLNGAVPTQETGHNLAVEIRPLRRDTKSPFMMSHLVYRFDESEFERFHEFMKERHKLVKSRETGEARVIPIDLYFGVYAIDMHAPCLNSKGEETKSYTTKTNAHCTAILPIDLDGVTHDEYLECQALFESKGIETYTIFSGHGYQIHVILDAPQTDLFLLKKWVEAFKGLGIKVDEKVIDCARILRAPLYNSKGFKKGEIIELQVLRTTTKRYNVVEVFKAFGVDYEPAKRPLVGPNSRRLFKCWDLDAYLSHPYASEHDGWLSGKIKNYIRKNASQGSKMAQKAIPEAEVKSQTPKQVLKATKSKLTTRKEWADDMLNLEKLYPNLNLNEFPIGIIEMLKGFRKGCADDMLTYLTLYLKYQQYSFNHIQQTLQTLAELNTYEWSWDVEEVNARFERIYYSDYKISKPMREHLEPVFGDLNPLNAADINFRLAKQLIIPHSLFTQQNGEAATVKDLTPGAFVLWLKMMLENNVHYAKTGKNKPFSFEEVMALYGKSKPSTIKALDSLVDYRVLLVDKKKNNRKQGQGYQYFVNLHKSLDKTYGFTKIPHASVENLTLKLELGRLSERAVMAAFYIRFRMGANSEQDISQDTIANVLGVTRRRVGQLMDELEEAKIITKKREGDYDPYTYIIFI